jgi:predicted nucleic acid-binding protein
MHLFLDANICLDLLDTTRPTSKAAVAWYMKYKDDTSIEFYFSGDFITTFYYILTERRKIDAHDVVNAIDALIQEVEPFYLKQSDFLEAKESFSDGILNDFEDLMILHSALRNKSSIFITQDIDILALDKLNGMKIQNIYN